MMFKMTWLLYPAAPIEVSKEERGLLKVDKAFWFRDHNGKYPSLSGPQRKKGGPFSDLGDSLDLAPMAAAASLWC
jgi:hypothetical protein